MSRFLSAALLLLASSALIGQANPPVSNWTVPPYTAASRSGGITTMTDFTPPRVFVAVVPCRVVDTRNTPGPFGGPALATNAIRTFDINDGPCPAIPAGVDAYSLNFGGILPPADGFLTAWPTGIAQPVVSQLNLVGGEVVANAAIVPASANGSINVLVNIGPTHIYIDINGYFSDALGNPNNYLQLTTNSVLAASFTNLNPTCGGPCGVFVEAAGVSAAAIVGVASSGSGASEGVRGVTFSSGSNSTGVGGHAGSPQNTAAYGPIGVRGGGSTAGVLGFSSFYGVIGDLVQGNSILTRGVLGYEGGATDYAVWADSNMGGSGAKFFVEPHPTDSSKVIRYVSLEGPEAGTYFRGRARFERGLARISVPEDFRMVTDGEGLSVQVTPIGGMASFAVMKADLNEIVVQSSRNVEFYYLVQGVRRTHKDLKPIGEGTEYMPERADSKMPAYLTDGQKQLLVQNGTYREDGSVNMETARRNGWDRVWAERERPMPAPSE